MVLGAVLPTVAHEAPAVVSFDGFGLTVLGMLEPAACAGVGAGLTVTPPVAKLLLRLGRIDVGGEATAFLSTGETIAGIAGLSGRGSDLKTSGNCTTLKPS